MEKLKKTFDALRYIVIAAADKIMSSSNDH